MTKANRMIVGGWIAAFGSLAFAPTDTRIMGGMIVGAIFVVGGIILKEISNG